MRKYNVHRGKIGVIWALTGLSILLLSAVFRLIPHAKEALDLGLSPTQWFLTAIWTLFMLTSEGYHGFQKSFSPRFASRMYELYQNPTTKRILLAPLFCIGYIESPKKIKLTVWGVSVAVLFFVLLVRQFNQPLRGMIDIGVIAGLCYGLISTFFKSYQIHLKR